jgi:hypothetical protein
LGGAQGVPAIDIDGGARDPARLVGHQEGDNGGDVGSGADGLQRLRRRGNLPQQLLRLVLAGAAKLRRHESRPHRIDPDAMLAEIPGQGSTAPLEVTYPNR